MKITYRQPDGSETTVDVASGTSVMRGAIDNDVSGIVAECGGNSACATCHVYVADGDVEDFTPRSDDEDEMLDFTAAPRRPNSRLSCQLVSDVDASRLSLEIPSEQV